jgi:hypothetical protein
VLNIVNPFTFAPLQPFKMMSPSKDESYIVNVVPDSPRVLGLVIETDIGEPSCSDETTLSTSTIPADVPRKSIFVI